MNITFKLSDRIIKAAIEDVEHWLGIRLREEQLRKLLTDHPRLLEGVNEGGIDTGEREELGDILVEKVGCKLSWPTYAKGSKAMDRFWKEFRQKAGRAGYKITAGLDED